MFSQPYCFRNHNVSTNTMSPVHTKKLKSRHGVLMSMITPHNYGHKICQTRLESYFFRSTSRKSSASPVILSEQLLMFYLGLSLADIPSAAHDRRPVFDLMTLKESITTKRKLPHSTIYPPTVVVVTCGWHLNKSPFVYVQRS